MGSELNTAQLGAAGGWTLALRCRVVVDGRPLRSKSVKRCTLFLFGGREVRRQADLSWVPRCFRGRACRADSSTERGAVVRETPLGSLCTEAKYASQGGKWSSLADCFEDMTVADLCGFTEDTLMAYVDRKGGHEGLVPAWLEVHGLRCYLRGAPTSAPPQRVPHPLPTAPVEALPPLDCSASGALYVAARGGYFMEELQKIPRSRWREVFQPSGTTLLHLAAQGDNVAAVVALLAHGLEFDPRETCTPAHCAASFGQARVLEVLCSDASINLQKTDSMSQTALDVALTHRSDQCVRVLVANGMRLQWVDPDLRHLITPKLEALERGVHRCRAVVIGLLALKRRRGDALHIVDRWVVREMAIAIWASRSDKRWSTRALHCSLQ